MKTIIKFFLDGGLFVYPILLVFVAGMAITIERWFPTGQIVDSLEMASVKALNCISDFNQRHFEAKSETPDKKQQVSNPEPRLGTAP